MRTADVRPFVPVEPEPSQPVDDAGHHVPRGAFRVGILDPQDERPAVPARVQPVEEGGTGTADMQVARRRRREADAKHDG